MHIFLLVWIDCVTNGSLPAETSTVFNKTNNCIYRQAERLLSRNNKSLLSNSLEQTVIGYWAGILNEVAN